MLCKIDGQKVTYSEFTSTLDTALRENTERMAYSRTTPKSIDHERLFWELQDTIMERLLKFLHEGNEVHLSGITFAIEEHET